MAKKIVRGSLRKHPFLLALRLLGRSPRETSPAAKSEEKRMFSQAMSGVVCCTAVFRVVTQRSTGGALRDETKNSCVADYVRGDVGLVRNCVLLPSNYK